MDPIERTDKARRALVAGQVAVAFMSILDRVGVPVEVFDMLVDENTALLSLVRYLRHAVSHVDCMWEHDNQLAKVDHLCACASLLIRTMTSCVAGDDWLVGIPLAEEENISTRFPVAFNDHAYPNMPPDNTMQVTVRSCVASLASWNHSTYPVVQKIAREWIKTFKHLRPELASRVDAQWPQPAGIPPAAQP